MYEAVSLDRLLLVMESATRLRLVILDACRGARLGEIAQLLTVDVRQLHGVWIFHITEEGSALKSTKTAGSTRVVPVHSKLINLGFFDYHAAMVSRGENQLPSCAVSFLVNPRRSLDHYFRDIGVKIHKKVNFHSFRHGIAGAFRFRRAVNVILGHA